MKMKMMEEMATINKVTLRNNPLRVQLKAKPNSQMSQNLKLLTGKKNIDEIDLPDDYKFETYPLWIGSKYRLVNFKSDPIFQLTGPNPGK